MKKSAKTYYDINALPLATSAPMADPEAGIAIAPPDVTDGCVGSGTGRTTESLLTVTVQTAFFPLIVVNVTTACPSCLAVITPLEDTDTMSVSELIQTPFLLDESTFFGVTVAFNDFF